MGTRDKASNKALNIKGKVKETVGKVTGNEDLEDEGRVDQAEAALRDAAEKAKEAMCEGQGRHHRQVAGRSLRHGDSVERP